MKARRESKIEYRGPCLEDFEIGKKLGKGRFGDVFVVREKKLGLVMAMKVINKKELKESQMENQLLF